jgi:hypothetical protein
MNMKLRQLAGTIFIILVIGMMIYLTKVSEGFEDRCGVDLRSCPSSLRCMNGWCKSDNPPSMPAISDLPITPDRY